MHAQSIREGVGDATASTRCRVPARWARVLRLGLCAGFGVITPAMLAWNTAWAEPMQPRYSRQPALYIINAMDPRMLTPGTRSEIELQAVLSTGATCSLSIYRSAWPIAHAYRIDPAIVAAIIETESSCDGNAVSSEGAHGLMQLMPHSGARVAYKVVHGRDGVPTLTDLHDPDANIELGVAYLSAMMRHYGYVASTQSRLRLVIASYHCGPDLIDKRIPRKQAAGWDATQTEQWIATHLPRQTRSYVDVVSRKAVRYGLAVMMSHADDAWTAQASQ